MQGKREGQEGDNPKFFGKKCIALLFSERLPLPFPRPPLGGSRQARLKMLLLLGPLFRKPCSRNSKPRHLDPWPWRYVFRIGSTASRGKRLLAKGPKGLGICSLCLACFALAWLVCVYPLFANAFLSILFAPYPPHLLAWGCDAWGVVVFIM